MKVAQRKNVNTPLAAWLNAQGMTMREFGRRIGIPHAKLSGIIDGKAMPSLITAYEVERLTQGEVPMEAWLGVEWARTKMAKLRAEQPEEYQPESFRVKKGSDESHEVDAGDGSEGASGDLDADGEPEAEGEDAFE